MKLLVLPFINFLFPEPCSGISPLSSFFDKTQHNIERLRAKPNIEAVRCLKILKIWFNMIKSDLNPLFESIQVLQCYLLFLVHEGLHGVIQCVHEVGVMDR